MNESNSLVTHIDDTLERSKMIVKESIELNNKNKHTKEILERRLRECLSPPSRKDFHLEPNTYTFNESMSEDSPDISLSEELPDNLLQSKVQYLTDKNRDLETDMEKMSLEVEGLRSENKDLKKKIAKLKQKQKQKQEPDGKSHELQILNLRNEQLTKENETLLREKQELLRKLQKNESEKRPETSKSSSSNSNIKSQFNFNTQRILELEKKLKATSHKFQELSRKMPKPILANDFLGSYKTDGTMSESPYSQIESKLHTPQLRVPSKLFKF